MMCADSVRPNPGPMLPKLGKSTMAKLSQYEGWEGGGRGKADWGWIRAREDGPVGKLGPGRGGPASGI